jgi:hypothetical protein
MARAAPGRESRDSDAPLKDHADRIGGSAHRYLRETSHCYGDHQSGCASDEPEHEGSFDEACAPLSLTLHHGWPHAY